MRTSISHDLQRRWRRQVGFGLSRQRFHRPRDAGAIGFLVKGGRDSALVQLHRVTLVAVHDRPALQRHPSIHVRGIRAARCEHGVLWGGAGGCAFDKDLALVPRPGGRGRRLDLRRPQLLELALRLDHRIDQAMRLQPSGHNRRWRLPQLWAAFDSSDALGLYGEGPEFEETCQWYGLSAAAAWEKFRRSAQGRAAYPLEWVSGRLDDAAQLYADLEGLPQRQVVELAEFPRGLAGHQGAMAFDLSAPVSTNRKLYT